MTIVELGISKEALSTKVLSKVAHLFNAHHIGIDLYAFPGATDYKRFHFIQADDITFAREFENWCGLHFIDKNIDLLFIDTDELYPHVKREIEEWFPFLNSPCTVMFRCTNLQKTLYYKDGNITRLGWDNERGVIRALFEYLGSGWNEAQEWQGQIGEWSIKHWPWGAGLTVMRRT